MRFSNHLRLLGPVVGLALLLSFLPAAQLYARGVPEEEVTVSTQWGGDDLEDLQEWSLFYTEESGVEISFRSAGEEEFRSTIPLGFEAGQSATDILAHPWIELHERFAREGHLLALDDLIDEDQFSEAVLEPVRVDGSIYAIPYRIALKPGFFYKQSFFAEHGLEVPETYDEFLSLLDEIREIPGIEHPIGSGNGDGWPLTDVTEGFILGFAGANVFQGLIDGTVSFTDPEVVEVMEEIARLIDEGYFSEAREWQTQAEELWNESYGIYWNHNTIHHGGFADNPDEIGFFPFPDTQGVTAAITYAAIPKYADNLEEAKAFVQWIQSQDGQTRFAEVRGELAARLDVPEETYPAHIADQQFLVEETQLLPDLDDFIGGEFLEAFRDQLKLLWAEPGRLDEVIENLSEVAPAAAGN